MYVTSRLISNPETLWPMVSGSTESVEKFKNILRHLNIKKKLKTFQNSHSHWNPGCLLELAIYLCSRSL